MGEEGGEEGRKEGASFSPIGSVGRRRRRDGGGDAKISAILNHATEIFSGLELNPRIKTFKKFSSEWACQRVREVNS